LLCRQLVWVEFTSPASPMNIEIKVITNAKKKEISSLGGMVKVKLTSQPVEGKANEELIEFLSSVFHVRKSEIQIIRGQREKKKIVALPIDEETLLTLLKENAKVTTG
jgi:uncharacterized protein